ncbi:MAG: lytic murein transglycosylase [Mycobacteriaceae bacterium]
MRTTTERPRGSSRRKRPIRALLFALVTVAVAVGLVGGLAVWFTHLAADNYVRPRTSAPAVAPPGPGAPTPPIDFTIAARQQADLVAWSAALSPTVAIPTQALQAYGYAAAQEAVRDPGCGIGWTTLAGIGAVESRHGSYGGARLDGVGRALPPIIGIPLDGAPGVQSIPDSDNGALDGDRNFDRAVGPMQFIPETWRKWGVDADDDGVADPNNINDAALTAARYLCAGGKNMTTAPGWRAALFTYNQSQSYANQVLQHAANYAAGLVG